MFPLSEKTNPKSEMTRCNSALEGGVEQICLLIGWILNCHRHHFWLAAVGVHNAKKISESTENN